MARGEREEKRLRRLREEEDDVAGSNLWRSADRLLGLGMSRWRLGVKEEEEREKRDGEGRESL